MAKLGKIFRIPEQISIKIAAGEVIERPASVIKELVENSIDAEATKIDINIEAGGKKLIQITDNGCGISNEYAKLSLERFTTSKLNISNSLLEDINTLGFRGEALASIASVSQMTLRTKTKEDEAATEIYCEGGEIKEEGLTASKDGTQITAKNLFYNFPARRKFLKSDRTEQGHIESIFSKLALPYFGISFVLRSDEKTLIEYGANEGLSDRVNKLFPKNSKPSLKFTNTAGKYSLKAFITEQGVDFRNSSNINIFINGRYIKDKIITHAVCEALRTHIGSGRYPGGVIFLSMPADSLDVNVHPSKAEVKFQDPGFIHSFVQKTLSSKLESKTPSPQKINDNKVSENTYFPFDKLLPKSKYEQNNVEDKIQETDIPFKSGYFSNLNILGQLKNSFIVCGDDKGVVIIDQHAAHERVTFDKLKEGYDKRKIPVQDLLFPLEFEIKGKKAIILKENLKEITDFGFIIEEFGGDSFIIRGVPEILVETDHIKTINDIIDLLDEFHSTTEKDKIIDEVLETLACHSSVRFSQSLSLEEMQFLMKSLDKLTAKTCPHGRPFRVSIDESELRKMFKRT